MTILWAGLPKTDPFAGTKFERKPMPSDEMLIGAIQKERGNLRRVAWELGDLDVETLYYHVAHSNVLRPIWMETQGLRY